ncbi:MAG TPA: mannonate dehydratase [Bryobacteraceae bacterium]|nr:mannonate dehydratase [Bryobacteraceae bacterium]
MNRRRFFQTAGGALALTPAALAQKVPSYTWGTPAEPGRKATMRIGTQHSDKDSVLSVMSSLGVKNICSGEVSSTLDDKWSVDGLSKLRERVEKHGITLDMVPLPLPSAVIANAPMAAIMLGQSPQRDREIEQIQQMIRNCAKVGIPAVKYNMSILGVVRIGRTPGRGESTYSTWNYQKAVSQLTDQDKLTEAGPVSADAYWERIDYFLERVVPVAAEEKTRMACHPHDPGMPEPEGYRGVHTVLGSPDGLKKFISMHENPYHGLNFCQGTVSEMLKDPNREIHDLIRYFGSRKKIFNVHFRNIHGGFSDFQETFPDVGSVNMIEAIRTYQEVGYPYMIMPDHVPQIPGDTGGAQAFAFSFGYIQALLQMLG